MKTHSIKDDGNISSTNLSCDWYETSSNLQIIDAVVDIVRSNHEER